MMLACKTTLQFFRRPWKHTQINIKYRNLDNLVLKKHQSLIKSNQLSSTTHETVDVLPTTHDSPILPEYPHKSLGQHWPDPGSYYWMGWNISTEANWKNPKGSTLSCKSKCSPPAAMCLALEMATISSERKKKKVP